MQAPGLLTHLKTGWEGLTGAKALAYLSSFPVRGSKNVLYTIDTCRFSKKVSAGLTKGSLPDAYSVEDVS